MPRGGENHAQGGKNRSGGGKIRARRTVYFFPPLGNFSCTPLPVYICYITTMNGEYMYIRNPFIYR